MNKVRAGIGFSILVMGLLMASFLPGAGTPVASAVPSINTIVRCYVYNGYGSGNGTNNKLTLTAVGKNYPKSGCDKSKGGPCTASGSSQAAIVRCTKPPAAGTRVAMTVSGPSGFSGSGDKIAYTFTVINNGRTKLSGIKVTASPSVKISCNKTSLASTDVATCRGTYTTVRKDYRAKKVTLKAKVDAKGSDRKKVSASKSLTVQRTSANRDSAVVAGEVRAAGLPQVSGDQNTINTILDIFFGILGGIAVLVVSIGGLRYVLANGDSGAITTAKNTILYALIGLMISILGYAIVNFVVRGLS